MLKTKCIMPAITYRFQTLTLAKSPEWKFKNVQRSMERAMHGTNS